MEIILPNLPNREIPDIAEHIYESLLGLLIEDSHLPWVESIFAPGHPCYAQYCRMQHAYERLLLRLNETDEDQDAEDMIDALLSHGKITALKMFEYGRIYQKMLDSNT